MELIELQEDAFIGKPIFAIQYIDANIYAIVTDEPMI